jgi:4-hydroxybenzoate polyprenyltransferase
MMLSILNSLRPKQWPKNFLVFVGLLFTINEHHPSSDILRVTVTFVFFCLLSGSVYLVNDVLDADRDRKHPKKRFRPIAHGDLSPRAAVVSAIALAVISLAALFALDTRLGICAATYFALTLAYSLALKHVVIVDVLALAAGFVLRTIAGALVIHVHISEWLLVCTTLLALFLGLAKRRNELLTMEGEASEHRKILEEYTPELLDQMIMITASCNIMAYMLYTFLSKTGEGHKYMMATVPFVVYGLFRYLYLVHTRNLGGSPESIVVEDKPLLINILLWMVVVVIVFLRAT